MIYAFICVQPGCELEDVTVKRNISYDQISEQCCEKCGEKIRRIYTSCGIKTSDGYKT
jgi:predicted nucleic acid-binding Zn ribbon protein